MQVTKESLYNDLSAVLLRYREMETDPSELYSMLVEIQNEWDSVVTTCKNCHSKK